MAVQLQRRVFHPCAVQLQGRVHRFAKAGLTLVVTAPGERAQAGSDAAHAVDQFVDGLEVGAGDIELAAFEEAHGIAGQGA
ncbi:hypothetical protein D3C71_1931800 [compost metagenome]